MPDFTGSVLLRRELLQRRLTGLLASYGYCGIDTPLLEPTELFLRKSGGEMASQLFSFTDPRSREVSLRPEFTAPAMRHYLEHAEQFELPARWQYCGPVFRFDGAVLNSSDDIRAGNQFTQIGAEMLGVSNVVADAELLELATSVLSESGLKRWTLRLADLRILNSLLDPLELSERARTFVVESVPQLSAGASAIPELMKKARRLHFIERMADNDYLSQAVNGLDDDEARNVLMGVLRLQPTRATRAAKTRRSGRETAAQDTSSGRRGNPSVLPWKLPANWRKCEVDRPTPLLKQLLSSEEQGQMCWLLSDWRK